MKAKPNEDPSMLKEALELLAKQSVLAGQPKIVQAPGEPSDRYGVVLLNGNVEWRRAERAIYDQKFLDLKSLCEMAVSAKAKSIWYSREKVIAVYDEPDRDTGELTFSPSPQLAALMVLEKNKSKYDQREFIQFLRIELAGCCPNSLVSNLRTVRWSNLDKGESTTKQGKVSLGNSIESKITGVEDVPEDVIMDVPVFTGHNYRSTVACDLLADPETKRFTLRPLAGEIETAFRNAEQMVADDLATILDQSKIPVYYGAP